MPTSKLPLNNKSSWSLNIFNGEIFLLGFAQLKLWATQKIFLKIWRNCDLPVQVWQQSEQYLHTNSKVYLEKKLSHFIKSYLERSIITRFSYRVLSFVYSYERHLHRMKAWQEPGWAAKFTIYILSFMLLHGKITDYVKMLNQCRICFSLAICLCANYL